MTTPTAAAVAEQADAWEQVRAALPAEIPVYQPAFVPERFGAPQLIEATADRYTVVYTAPDENIALILGSAAGAYANDARPETMEPIPVLGGEGQLSTNTAGSPHLAVSWQGNGNAYQIKAYSQQMTKAEMEQIAAGLAPVE